MVSNDQFELNERVRNVIEWIEMVFKYELLRISLNTETLDTHACNSKSTLISVIGAILGTVRLTDT